MRREREGEKGRKEGRRRGREREAEVRREIKYKREKSEMGRKVKGYEE